MTTILIVDDHDDSRHAFRMTLLQAGYTVIDAADGAAALAAAQDSPPDLVISEVLMPVMDGYALCRAWRRDPVLTTVPFVFLTAAHSGPQDEAFARQLGATRCMTKPLAPAALCAEVADVLAQRAAGSLPPPAPLADEDATYQRLYSEVLVGKLAAKISELEAANRACARAKTGSATSRRPSPTLPTHVRRSMTAPS